MPGPPQVKLSDIAARAHTSIATVSLALSGSSRISDDTRQRIRDLSQELGYRPRRGFRSDVARKAAAAQDRLRFGFLALGRLDDPTNAAHLQALSQVTAQESLGLELMSLPVDTPAPVVVDKAVEFGKRLDGLLLMGTITIAQLRQIDQTGVPAVLYGYPLGAPDEEELPVPIVTSDWVSMGHRATRALLEAGHRRIGFIAGSFLPNMWHARCFDGYAAALLHADLAIDKSLAFFGAPGDERCGVAAAGLFRAMANRPSAYVAVNPGTAGRFVQAMREGGVAVPPSALVVCGYARQMPEFGLEGYPLVGMDPVKLFAAAIMQLRAKCLQQSSGNYTVLVPFTTHNLPAGPA